MSTAIFFDVPRSVYVLSALVLFTSCGPGKPAETEPIQHEGPEDEILTIASTWQAPEQGTGFREPPSNISVFEVRKQSSIQLKRGKAVAKVVIEIEESFRMRDGTTFVCQAQGITSAGIAYARHGQEPAIEIEQPSLSLSRQCDKPGFPEPNIRIEPSRARFALRSEQLIGYDPPLEKRVFLPVE